jgi:ABC-type transport system involved in multi-copper enzyme maturation permease subunit
MSTLTISGLTIREAQRRRLLWVGFVLGVGFLVVFAIGFHVIYREFQQDPTDNDFEIVIGVLLTAGLYAVNFLVTIMTVLVSVTTISSEIDSHTIDAIVTKPIGRWEVVLGKWLAFAALLIVYLLFLAPDHCRRHASLNHRQRRTGLHALWYRLPRRLGGTDWSDI